MTPGEWKTFLIKRGDYKKGLVPNWHMYGGFPNYWRE